MIVVPFCRLRIEHTLADRMVGEVGHKLSLLRVELQVEEFFIAEPSPSVIADIVERV